MSKYIRNDRSTGYSHLAKNKGLMPWFICTAMTVVVIHNLADQQIEIDLDDGVVVNYAKFEKVLAKI